MPRIDDHRLDGGLVIGFRHDFYYEVYQSFTYTQRRIVSMRTLYIPLYPYFYKKIEYKLCKKLKKIQKNTIFSNFVVKYI